VLAARVPTAMLFVRNPTGVSHSPAEHAELADCEAGVRALAAVLENLAGPAASGGPAAPADPACPPGSDRP
jgi:N-carbamoyl-L-amino-acid hydrolase